MPYGWQFCGEDVYIPSERGLRLNIFGMIDRRNRYEGFTTTENMTADKVAIFLDRMSLRISKRTLVVLLTTQVYTDAGLCGNFVPYGRSRGGSFSFSLLIAHILILPRLFGASSRGNGSDLWIISIQTPYSMPPTEPWRQSGLDSESILTMCLV